MEYCFYARSHEQKLARFTVFGNTQKFKDLQDSILIGRNYGSKRYLQYTKGKES